PRLLKRNYRAFWRAKASSIVGGDSKIWIRPLALRRTSVTYQLSSWYFQPAPGGPFFETTVFYAMVMTLSFCFLLRITFLRPFTGRLTMTGPLSSLEHLSHIARMTAQISLNDPFTADKKTNGGCFMQPANRWMKRILVNMPRDERRTVWTSKVSCLCLAAWARGHGRKISMRYRSRSALRFGVHLTRPPCSSERANRYCVLVSANDWSSPAGYWLVVPA